MEIELEMNNDFKEIPLSEAVEITGGGTPRRSNSNFWGGNIPWLKVKDFANCNRYVSKSEETITEDGLNNSSTKILKPGQLIISARGTVGAIAQLKIPMAFNQSCYGLNAKSDVAINDFLYYLIRYSFSNFQKMSHGAVFNTITRETFDHIYVKIPPLHIQERIADILGTLDDKIELNQQMNKTLESMARALFKSWFVDFEPVYAKMEGRDYPLPTEIMELFPDELVESEMGLIPKGWKVGKFGDEFNIVMGQSPPGYTYNEIGEGLPFYQGRKDFGFRFPAKRMFCSDPKRRAKPGDSLVSVRAPVGDVNMAPFKCCIGRGLSAIRHKSNSSSYTYYSMLWLKEYLKQFEAEGTVFGSISKNDFSNMECIKPQHKIIDAFENIVSDMDGKINNNYCQNEMIEKMRDALLPKLMNGQFKV